MLRNCDFDCDWSISNQPMYFGPTASGSDSANRKSHLGITTNGKSPPKRQFRHFWTPLFFFFSFFANKKFLPVGPYKDPPPSRLFFFFFGYRKVYFWGARIFYWSWRGNRITYFTDIPTFLSFPPSSSSFSLLSPSSFHPSLSFPQGSLGGCL